MDYGNYQNLKLKNDKINQINDQMKPCQVCGVTHSGAACAVDPVQFQWKHGGDLVFVQGSWSKWQASIRLSKLQLFDQINNQNQQIHQVSLSLPVGVYQYKYIVDGRWDYDQQEPFVDNGQGSFNNIIEVFPKVITHGQSDGYTDITESDSNTIDKQIQQNQNKPLRQLLQQKKLQQEQKMEQNMEIKSNQLIGIQERNENDNEQNQIELNTFPRVSSFDQNLENSQEQSQQKNLIKVKITTLQSSQQLELFGSWDNWQIGIKMKVYFNSLENQYENFADIKLLPGKYEYKFKCDDHFIHDPNHKYVKNDLGSYNNLIVVSRMDRRNSSFNYLPQLLSLKLNIKKMSWHRTQICNAYWNKIQGHSMDLVGDHIYIYGGQLSGNYTESMSVMNIRNYELDLIEYSNIAPRERAFHKTVVYGNKILVYGGYNRDNVLQDYIVYNTATKTWHQYELKGQRPSKRERFSLEQMGRHNLILFGGYFCSEDSEADFHYNDLYILNLERMAWAKINIDDNSETPQGRFAHTAKCISKKMYVFGGVQKSLSSNLQKNFNDVWCLNLDQQKGNLEWFNISDQILGQAPEPRHGHSMVRVEKRFVFFGGRGNNKQMFNDVFVLDVQKLEWIWPEIQGEPPISRYYHQAVRVSQYEIMIVGGATDQKQINKHRHVYSIKFDLNQSGTGTGGNSSTFRLQSQKSYRDEEESEERENPLRDSIFFKKSIQFQELTKDEEKKRDSDDQI